MSVSASSTSLALMRSRLTLLFTKLDDLHRRLCAAAPASVAWHELLASFSVVCSLLSAVAAAQREAVSTTLLFPSPSHLAGATPWWRETALPAMLSTRLEPEMEAEADLFRGALAGDAALVALKRDVEAHNAGLRSALAALAKQRNSRPVVEVRLEARPPSSHDAVRLLAAVSFGEGLRIRR